MRYVTYIGISVVAIVAAIYGISMYVVCSNYFSAIIHYMK